MDIVLTRAPRSITDDSQFKLPISASGQSEFSPTNVGCNASTVACEFRGFTPPDGSGFVSQNGLHQRCREIKIAYVLMLAPFGAMKGFGDSSSDGSSGSSHDGQQWYIPLRINQ